VFSEIISIGGKNWKIGGKKISVRGLRAAEGPQRVQCRALVGGPEGQSPPAEKEI